MAETADYDPGPWRGHDFGTARAAYDAHAGRSYADAKHKGVAASTLVPDEVVSNSESPLVIACDVTGSMGAWPATIFSKLPYLDIEGRQYLGEDMEISFAAVGDCYSDQYPLQVQNFVQGKDLEDTLKNLIVEGGGGGGKKESYELAALYYARNARMPKAIRPIFIFIGDEGIYDQVPQDISESRAKTKLDASLSIEAIMEELKSKFAVYLVRKPYGSQGDYSDTSIQAQWAKLIGDDHICILPEAGRVVDVIFGILAKETGRIDYFRKEIEDRQTKDQVNVVMKSLNTIHHIDDKAKGRKLLAKPQASITKRHGGDEGGGKKSINLLD